MILSRSNFGNGRSVFVKMNIFDKFSTRNVVGNKRNLKFNDAHCIVKNDYDAHFGWARPQSLFHSIMIPLAHD